MSLFAKVQYAVQNFLGKASEEAQKSDAETTEPVVTEKKD